MAGVDTRAAAIATLSAAEWRVRSGNSEDVAADRFLARATLACLEKTAPRVKRMLTSLRKLDGAGALRSGYALLTAIRESAQLSFAASEDHAADLASKEYYSSGMSADEVLAATDVMEKDLAVAPPELRATQHFMQRFMIDKFEAVSGCGEKARELGEKIYDATVLGTTPFTPDQLAAIIAGHMRRACRGHAKAARSDGGGGGGGGGSDASCKCVVCGERGHKGRDCPKRCMTCNIKCCPGARGAQCVVTARSKPEAVRNALGNPLPPELLEKLVTAWQSKRAAAAAAAANDEEVVDLTSADW